MRRVVLIATVCLLSLAATSLASARVLVSHNCLDAKYKPHQIIIACGDATTYLAHLSWHSWGLQSARGQGTVKRRTCQPSCSSSPYKRYAARVRLTRPRSCARNHVKQFSRAIVTFTGAVPSGLSRQTTFKLTCGAVPL